MDMKRNWIVASIFTATLAVIAGGCGVSKESGDDLKDGKVQLRFATWDVAEDMDRQQKR